MCRAAHLLRAESLFRWSAVFASADPSLFVHYFLLSGNPSTYLFSCTVQRPNVSGSLIPRFTTEGTY